MVLCAWHNSDLFLLNTQTGLMDRICGTGCVRCYNGDEQPAVDACVDLPASVAFDPPAGCASPTRPTCIRMIDENGVIHCIAGTAPVWDTVNLRYNAQFGYAVTKVPRPRPALVRARADRGSKRQDLLRHAGSMYIADTKNNCCAPRGFQRDHSSLRRTSDSGRI
jgi:hypothetical protein